MKFILAKKEGMTRVFGEDGRARAATILKTDGVKLYQEKPIEMGATSHWFQFADPDGNVWDVLGHP